MAKSNATATAKPKPTQAVATDKKPFTPWTTEQKKEYAKQFSPSERVSYHKGRENAYRHSANMAGRQAKFIHDNEQN